LDEVDGLGSYIEVEKMSDEDGEKIQNELFDFLQILGVSKEDRVLKGYDTLMWLKNNQ
jgi:adenylate cyclase class IV